MTPAKAKARVAALSVGVGVVLTGMKLTVGLLTGSLGILSEALHSLLDLAAAVMTWGSVRLSSKPADEAHPYGHGKIENLSALGEAALLLLTCVWIVYEAAQRLLGKASHVEATFWAFFVMAVSLLLDVLISRALSAAARKHHSQALEADALHYSSDILSSGVVIIGLIGVRLGASALDPVAALLVAVLVTVASLRLGWRAAQDLLDSSPKGLTEDLRAAIATMSGVRSVDRVRVRRSGASVFVDVVVVTGRLVSVDRSHGMAETIEDEVRRLVPGSDVLVHFHPTNEGEGQLQTVHAVAGRFPQIQDIHNLYSYLNGATGRYVLCMHVKMAPTLPLGEAHDIMDRLEIELKRELPQVEQVETHLETADRSTRGAKVLLPREQQEALSREILKDARIREVHDATLHLSGGERLLTLHVLVPRDLTVAEVHEAATLAEQRARAVVPGAERVLIHTEPEP